MIGFSLKSLRSVRGNGWCVTVRHRNDFGHADTRSKPYGYIFACTVSFMVSFTVSCMVSCMISSRSLLHRYEKQILGAADGETDALKKEHAEITTLWEQLSHKLDALSNFHFKAKPMLPEVGITPAKVGAIQMEEIVPMTMTDAMARAPEEVDKKKRGRDGVLKGEHEETPEERQTHRRAKKSARRKKLKEAAADARAVAKINPGMGNKHATKQLLEDISKERNGLSRGTQVVPGSSNDVDYSKSAAFFNKLQEDAKRAVHGDSAGGSEGGGGRGSKRQRRPGGDGAKFML